MDQVLTVEGMGRATKEHGLYPMLVAVLSDFRSLRNKATMDTTKIERIAGDYWRNSHLSIARFYGAININGKRYVLDRATDELVREDIYKRASEDEKARRKEAERKYWEAQRRMFNE